MRPALTPTAVLVLPAGASSGTPAPASPSSHTAAAEATMRAPPPAQVPMLPGPGGGGAAATSAARLVETLVRAHGEAARPRAERGVKQVTAFWRAEDGDAAALKRFVTSEFIADPAVLARTRDRLSDALGGADRRC